MNAPPESSEVAGATGSEGGVGFWVVAPHVPDMLRRVRALHPVSAGCYSVGSADASFLWVAANELPLDDALILFLIVRSGRALVEMAEWILGRRPPQWVFRMLSSAAMDPVKRQELLDKLPPIPPTSDPALLDAREDVARYILRDRRLWDRLVKPEVDAAAQESAKRSLLRVLARRGFTLSPEQQARIDAETTVETLERWLDQAITAGRVEEVLA